MYFFPLKRLLFSAISLVLIVQAISHAQTYCIPAYSQGCGSDDGIKGFTFNGTVLSTGSGCSVSSYQFFNQTFATVSPGQSYNFTLSFINSINDEYVSVWIDANKDGVFSSSELALQTNTPVTEPFIGSIQVPSGVNGTVRMRIQVRFEDMANDPCGTYTWGETEDYLLKMDCPTSLTITQTQGSGTDASFSASANIIASNRIQTGAVATYSAGTSVLLQPGFVSETGSVFTAKTGGCPN